MNRKLLILTALFLPIMMLALFLQLAGSVQAVGPCSATHDDGITVFGDVQSAVNAAGIGATVKVAGTCSGVNNQGGQNQTVFIDKTLILRGGYDGADWLTVDPVANPTVLDALQLGRVMRIKGTNGITVEHVIVQNGQVTGLGLLETHCGGGIYSHDALNMNDVEVRNNSSGMSGGGLCSEGPVTMAASTLRDNNAVTSGGGAYVSRNDVTVENSLFENNTSEANVGGGLYVSSPELEPKNLVVEGSTFLGNRNLCQGPGVGICHGAGIRVFGTEVSISGSLFQDNQAIGEDSDGGAIDFLASFTDPDMTLVDVDFITNTAGRYGGAINSNRPVFITDGRFEGNHAHAGDLSSPFNPGGGGLYGTEVFLTGTQFIDNSTRLSGGGINAWLGLTAVDAVFNGNSAQANGGAIAVRGVTGPTSLQGLDIIGNSASENGAGVWIDFGAVTVEGGRFEENVSDAPENDGGSGLIHNGGGGLWARDEVVITGTQFISNTTQASGGAIHAEGDVTLSDAVISQNTALGDFLPFSFGGGGVFARQNVVFDDTTFLDNQALGLGGGLYAGENVEGSGGEVVGNAAYSGAGMFVAGHLALDGTEVRLNQATWSGGGALVGQFDPGSADLNNVRFEENTAVYGGGLYSYGPLSMAESDFLDNSSTNAGGGIYATGDVTITGSLLEANSSGGIGGAAFLFGAFFDDLLIENTQVLSNHAASNGGGLYASFSPVTATDVTFANNSSEGQGGGLWTSHLYLDGDSSFSGNTAALDGGGAYVQSNGWLTETLIAGNTSSGSGGGLYVNAQLTMQGGEISENEAGVHGGGVYVRFRGYFDGANLNENIAGGDGGGAYIARQLFMTDTMVLNNTSAGLGGGLVLSRTFGSTASRLVNPLVAGNTAAADGDGLYVNIPGSVDILHGTIANPGAAAGQGVYVQDGTVGITNTIVSTFSVGVEAAGGVVNTDHNLYFANGQDEVGVAVGASNLNGDPHFVGAGDYHLGAGSAALNNALNLGILFDIEGNPRPQGPLPDRGAYERAFTTLAVDAGSPYEVAEGGTVMLTANTSGDAVGGITYAWDLDGDAVYETPGQSVSFSAAGLDGPDSVSVGVQASDTAGQKPVDTATINVLNEDPVLGPISGPVDPVAVGEQVNFSAPFSDAGIPDTHSAEWDWGDGSTSPGVVDQVAGTVTGAHSYTAPDFYTVNLRLSDDDGGSDSKSFQYVVVYDPNGDFVSGGGWFESEPGSYPAEPELMGPASFSFISSYKKGDAQPRGETTFRFRMAGLQFKSDGYDWLVVNQANSLAQYHGTGSVNGVEGFNFMVWAFDAEAYGSGDDTFRIRIWHEDGSGQEETIYDNGAGQPIDGSIVIHARGQNGN